MTHLSVNCWQPAVHYHWNYLQQVEIVIKSPQLLGHGLVFYRELQKYSKDYKLYTVYTEYTTKAPCLMFVQTIIITGWSDKTNKAQYKLWVLYFRRSFGWGDLVRSCSDCKPFHLYFYEKSNIWLWGVRSSCSRKCEMWTSCQSRTSSDRATEACRFWKQKLFHNWGLMVQESF